MIIKMSHCVDGQAEECILQQPVTSCYAYRNGLTCKKQTCRYHMDVCAKASLRAQRLPKPSWVLLWVDQVLLIYCACFLCACEEIFICTQFCCCTSSHLVYLPLASSNGAWAATHVCRARWVRPFMFRLARPTGLKYHHSLTVLEPPRPAWLLPPSNQGQAPR